MTLTESFGYHNSLIVHTSTCAHTQHARTNAQVSTNSISEELRYKMMSHKSDARNHGDCQTNDHCDDDSRDGTSCCRVAQVTLTSAVHYRRSAGTIGSTWRTWCRQRAATRYPIRSSCNEIIIFITILHIMSELVSRVTGMGFKHISKTAAT